MEKSICHDMDRKPHAKDKKSAIAEPSKIHPDHGAQKKRLNRVRGQIEGIDRMIAERRYCMDIITQIKAAKSALGALEAEIIETHLRACAKTAFQSKGTFESEKKIQEIMQFIR